MKKLLTTLLFGSFFSACAERQPVPAIPSDPEIEGKIEKLLKGMTLEEKIGQMCELTIGAVTDKNDNKLSEALLDTVIGGRFVTEYSLRSQPKKGSIRRSDHTDSKEIFGRNWDSMYLWFGSDSRGFIYTRRYLFSSRHQYGGCF